MQRRPRGAAGAGRAISRILAGTLVGQGTIVLVSPVLTRVYSASDFGLLAIITAIAAVLGGFASLAYEAAVPIAATDRDAAGLILFGLGSILLVAAAVGVASYLLRDLLGDWFDSKMLSRVWWLIPLTIAAVGLFNVMSSWLIRRSEYGRLGSRNAVQGLAQAGWSVAFGLLGSKFGLASSLAIGRLAGAAVAGWMPTRRILGIAPRPARDQLRIMATYRRFPMILSWSRLVNALGLQAPVVLIAWWFGALELGLFAITLRVLSGPVGMLADAAAQYFEGAFAKRLRDGGELHGLVLKLAATMGAIGIVPTVVVWLAAPDIYAFVFGEDWRNAGEISRIVVVVCIFQLAISPISRALPLLDRQGLQIAWDIARAAAVVAAITVPAALGADLGRTLAVMTATQCVSYAIMLVLVLTAVRDRRESHARIP